MQSIALFSDDTSLRDMLNQLEDFHVNYFSLDLNPDNLPKDITLAVFDFDVVPLSLLDEWEQFPRLHLRKMAVVSAENLTLVDAVLERLDNYIVRPLSLERATRSIKISCETLGDGELAYYLGFDSKSHLSSIRGYSSLISKMYDDLSSEDIIEFAEYIELNADNNYYLIDSVRTHLDVEFRRIYYFKHTQLHEILDAIWSTKQLEIKQQTLTLSTPETVLTLYVDWSKIVFVISSLLDNASKCADEYSEIELSLTIIDKSLQIIVRDSGYGIKLQFYESIFTKYARGAHSYYGLGLSLYLSKQIIEMHGGEIWFESELGVGTTFYFTLPIAK